MNHNTPLSPDAILPHLRTRALGRSLRVYDTLPSTNLTAKEDARAGAPHGHVVVADAQTAGRGRFGREFSSPAGSGLYLTVVLRLPLPPSQISLVTPAAAVAAARAAETLGAPPPAVKWVNDLLRDGRKVCGILAEGGMAGGRMDWCVLGIGVNVTAFPPELAGRAAALFPDGADRARLAAEILNELEPLTDALPDTAGFFGEYRRRCALLGRKVAVFAPGGLETGEILAEGVAEDIDGGFRLLVRLPDGGLRAFSSGEVSVRGLP